MNTHDPMVRNDGRLARHRDWIMEAALEYGRAKLFNVVRDAAVPGGWMGIDPSMAKDVIEHMGRKLCQEAVQYVQALALPAKDGDPLDFAAHAEAATELADHHDAQARQYRDLAKAMSALAKKGSK